MIERRTRNLPAATGETSNDTPPVSDREAPTLDGSDISTAESLVRFVGTWQEDDREETPEAEAAADFATAEALLRHAGTWVGDDLEEPLAEVYALRIRAQF